MSIRTLVEFNHDYIQQLVDRKWISDEFARFILERGEMWRVNGAEIKDQFHHSRAYKIVTDEDRND